MINGAICNFGSEHLVIFGFDVADEMDPASGGGWMRLRDDDKLEGEFVNNLGRFVAKRVISKKKPRAAKCSKGR